MVSWRRTEVLEGRAMLLALLSFFGFGFLTFAYLGYRKARQYRHDCLVCKINEPSTKQDIYRE
jgi:hypothetical protein